LFFFIIYERLLEGCAEMKVCLVVNRIDKSKEKNIKDIHLYIKKAASNNCDLVMFPEASTTGLINNDEPIHDLALGITLDSSEVQDLCNLAKANNINVAIGIFEREECKLYDSALFINRNGEIGLNYRRISKGWHGLYVDKDTYQEGCELGIYHSDIGSISFLICGDLFDERLVKKINEMKPDYLLYPFARCFNDNNISQTRFDAEEYPNYKEQIIKAGVKTLMVNYIDDEYFGGAFILSASCSILVAPILSLTLTVKFVSFSMISSIIKANVAFSV